MSTETQNHIGRKISRIRELRNMKQEFLAQELGVSQQTISNIENSENVEEETLQKIAVVLGVTPKAIQKMVFLIILIVLMIIKGVYIREAIVHLIH